MNWSLSNIGVEILILSAKLASLLLRMDLVTTADVVEIFCPYLFVITIAAFNWISDCIVEVLVLILVLFLAYFSGVTVDVVVCFEEDGIVLFKY